MLREKFLVLFILEKKKFKPMASASTSRWLKEQVKLKVKKGYANNNEN